LLFYDVSNETAHLNIKTKVTQKWHLLKAFLRNKNDVIIKVAYSFNLSAVFKINFCSLKQKFLL